MTKKTLGEVLRRARDTKELSLRDVERASKGRLSNGHLSMLESNAVKQPSPHHLYLLAGILGLSYEALLGLAGYVVPGNVESNSEGHSAEHDDLTPAERRELENYAQYLRARRHDTTSGKSA